MVKKLLRRFHPIPESYGRTDRRTEFLYQYHVSALLLTRDKNLKHLNCLKQTNCVCNLNLIALAVAEVNRSPEDSLKQSTIYRTGQTGRPEL